MNPFFARRMMTMDKMEGDGKLKYKTGEFIGSGSGDVIIEHGLGEIPFLFAFIGDAGEETSGMLSGIFMNTSVTTNYTTVLQKKWLDCGCKANGGNTAYTVSPNSTSYGIMSVDENQIHINRYGSGQNFISGKTYKWIAIADWR